MKIEINTDFNPIEHNYIKYYSLIVTYNYIFFKRKIKIRPLKYSLSTIHYYSNSGEELSNSEKFINYCKII